MKFSLKWLQQHINLRDTVNTLTLINKLNEIGLEVINYEDQSHKYRNFIIAKILEAREHHNAKNLKICKVTDGTSVFNVVCGASNARNNINVVLAKANAIIPKNLLQIKNSLIRGIESEGMLCSAEELCIINAFDDIDISNDGIIEISCNASIGQSFAEYANLNDTFITVDLTPNRRKDCASVYGIARELAAADCGILKYLVKPQLEQHLSQCKIAVNLIAKDHCSQFNCFTATSEIKVNPLFSHLNEDRLVNLSNFVMLDIGNPNHFYDLNKISGNIIDIRFSYENEKFIAIGGKQYILPKGLLVIADKEKILSIAGIIGGELSKVDQHTNEILVEVANFSCEAIMFASQTLNILTESKYRFEAGIDVNSVDYATERIKSHFAKYSDTIKIYGKQQTFTQEVTLSLNQLERYLGIQINDIEIEDMLMRLSFFPKLIDNREFLLQIPSWKQGNILSSYEVIEELLKIGLIQQINTLNNANNKNLISSSRLMTYTIDSNNNTSYQNIDNNRIIKQSIVSQLRQHLIYCGMNEIMTWSFVPNNLYENHLEKNHINKYFLNINNNLAKEEIITVKNAINNNFVQMRRSLPLNLVQTLYKYPNNNENNIAIFEIGNVYYNHNDFQSLMIGGLRVNSNFYEARNDLLSLLKIFGMSDEIVDYTFDINVPKYYHRGIRIKLGPTTLGICGELHPLHIKEKAHNIVSIFELFTKNIPSKYYKVLPFKQFHMPIYQRIDRDLAFIIDSDINVSDVLKTVKNLKEKLINDVVIFDVYEKNNQKSVAIKLYIQPVDGNITDEMIHTIMQKVIQAVITKHNGILRCDNYPVQ